MHIVVNNDTEYTVPKNVLEQASQLIIEYEKISDDSVVSLAFVSSAVSQQLNKDYRGKDYPTDVLSFSEKDVNQDDFIDISVDDSITPIGEIIICTDVMERQAIEKNHSVDHECLILFIHGFFHILGYDHEVDEEAEIMEKKERDILESLIESNV